jgi:RecJ-like exonuclease
MTVINITHGEDPDGLSCAAMLQIKDAEVKMANYDNFDGVLTSIQPPVDEVFITDLNIREALLDEIQRISHFAEITIIDHHPMKEEVYTQLIELGVQLIHDLRECAGVLIYNHFKNQLPQKASKLAAYAAISDMFEDGPLASEILARMDRKLTQHEALILSHAMQQDSTQEFKNLILKELSQFTYPHRIPGVLKAASDYLERAAEIREDLPDRTTRLGRLAYTECKGDISTGAVANLIMDTMGVDVGICYKGNEEFYNISLRGERNLKEHLGDIAQNLATEHGGFGGGHKRAAGSKIPREKITDFIKDISKVLD